ncbi:unnamed protein product [Hyaloperonospora brassicae]|nr:unnamed protein product [Hyaloperonospora brassicae]
MESVGQRVEEEGLINNGKVANLEEFAVLLGGVYRPLDTTHWNYGKVVEVLTKSKINKGLVPFQPEELAEAFHSLRKAPDMMEHADRLQGILAYKNPDLLENEKLFRLWTAGGDALAPEDVFKILTSGFRYKAPDVTLPFERKRMVRIDNHVVKPLQRYIESYRKAKHDYSKDKETELLSVFTKYPGFTFGLRADEKTPKHGTNE